MEDNIKEAQKYACSTHPFKLSIFEPLIRKQDEAVAVKHHNRFVKKGTSVGPLIFKWLYTEDYDMFISCNDQENCSLEEWILIHEDDYIGGNDPPYHVNHIVAGCKFTLCVQLFIKEPDFRLNIFIIQVTKVP